MPADACRNLFKLSKKTLYLNAITYLQLQDENNELLQPLMNRLPHIKWADTRLSIDISMSLSSLIPPNIDIFYTYKGSLTTPPCSEVVTWIIFATPVPISFRQVFANRV